jgi:Uma2 family endonuclease
MATTTSAPPILESGDRLTRDEFHRRYCARPDIKRAELVEGVVYVGSPVSGKYHGAPHAVIVGWLIAYGAGHAGIQVMDNTTVRLDEHNELQPDAILWRAEPNGPSLDPRGYVEGAPQLVVEVAASSASYDLHDKKEAYRRNGIQEYVVWRVMDGAIDWFRLVDGAFVLVEPDEGGILECTVFPGLRLDVPKLLAGDLAGLLAALA